MPVRREINQSRLARRVGKQATHCRWTHPGFFCIVVSGEMLEIPGFPASQGCSLLSIKYHKTTTGIGQEPLLAPKPSKAALSGAVFGSGSATSAEARFDAGQFTQDIAKLLKMNSLPRLPVSLTRGYTHRTAGYAAGA